MGEEREGVDPLEPYNRMRRFDRTPEPEGVRADSGGRLSFVVQKHDATRLHYDFRLEHGGVLWSWAVPQGPTYDPDVKRLAVRTEDHPVAYGGFEGVIPKGEYGGGTVIVWDRGTWTAREDPVVGIEKGHLSFDLHGERLHGHWHLVRLKNREGEEGDNWLLFKAKDGLQSKDVDVTAMFEDSVLSGRSIAEVAAEPHRVWRSGKGVVGPIDPTDVDGAVESDLPRFFEPMLCQAVEVPPDGDDWLHEIKYDGYRLQVRIDGDEVRLYTRRGNDWTEKFGHLAEALAVLPVNSAVLDGEVVVLRPDGGSDFGLLVQALGTGDQSVMHYVAFDLLYAEGHDLRAVPLAVRKGLLHTLLDAAPPLSRPVRYVDHVQGHGRLFFEQVGKLGLEGVISKRRDAPYVGGRSERWRKAKHLQRQEFVITGWTDLEGGTTGLGAVLLGGWEEGVLRPVGKAGSGFTDAQRVEYAKALATVAREEPAVVYLPEDLDDIAGVHWVEPVLVAEVAFSGWTHEDRLRHPVFVGLRQDKDPDDVPRKPGVPMDPALPEPTEAGRRALSRIKITTPDRVLWPDLGITKAELLAYWAALGDVVLDELGNRPLSLVRCPQGVTGQQFFQKHAEKGVPDFVKHVDIPQEGTEPFLYLDDLEGLLSLAQLNTLELHPWGATVEAPLTPDRVIFDLDPDEGLPWARVAEAAFWLRETLEELGLTPFARTTGGKGLHVVVPVEPTRSWDEVRAFARGVAELQARRHPGRFTLSHAKDARKGRLYVDVLRNALGATAVGTWSTRARPGAPVAVPVRWDEVVGLGGGDRWNVRTLFRRLAHLDADPWEGLAEAAAEITDATMQAAGATE